MSNRRAIVIVLDGCGVGAAPDAEVYGDVPGASTLAHVLAAAGPLDLPNLSALGFLPGVRGTGHPRCSLGYGRLRPLSAGKDSVTGHWEMMGIVADRPFATYPDGFPPETIRAFEAAIGRGTLGNVAASGTEIIARLGAEHVATGRPIVYTSGDSVFQIAAHEGVVPIEELYRWCETARGISDVQRVIARPFAGEAGAYVRTERRRDYPATPPPNLVDRIGEGVGGVLGIGVVPELFGGRGFRPSRRTQSNPEHARALDDALATDAAFVFANFEDFDMKYGHRNDPIGFGRCLEEFDLILGRLLHRIGEGELLILTADHGNDPTDASTDHTREYVPYVALECVGESSSRDLGDLDGFATIGDAVARHLGFSPERAPSEGP